MSEAGLAQKSEEAFRSISEVAAQLQIEPHVLRFWERKFKEIQPMKHTGGRRFYRPEDIALITGIHHLLHKQGFTIKGAQKLLATNGTDYVRTVAQNDGVSIVPSIPPTDKTALQEIRTRLQEVHALLTGNLQNIED